MESEGIFVTVRVEGNFVRGSSAENKGGVVFSNSRGLEGSVVTLK